MGGHEDDGASWSAEQSDPIASDIYFTIPFDAPPVPTSPTPEELAFLESSKSRSLSYPSTQEAASSITKDPPSPKEKHMTLFERRRPELRHPQLSLPNILTARTGVKPARPSFASSRDTSTSLPSNFHYRRPSSVRSSALDEELSTPATSLWSADIMRRKSSIADSSLTEHGLMVDTVKVQQDTSSPEFEYRIETERKIGNTRLCDVLRALFASDGYTPRNLL